MNISQSRLAMLYVGACLLGVLLGLLYDGFRILRIFLGEHFSPRANYFHNVKLPLIKMGTERTKRRAVRAIVVFWGDFLFCVISGVALILLLYQLNNGKIRLPVFPLAAAGFVIYRYTLGRPIMLLSETVAFLLEATLRYACFFAIFPWKWIFCKIATAIRGMVRKNREKRKKQERKYLK